MATQDHSNEIGPHLYLQAPSPSEDLDIEDVVALPRIMNHHRLLPQKGILKSQEASSKLWDLDRFHEHRNTERVQPYQMAVNSLSHNQNHAILNVKKRPRQTIHDINIQDELEIENVLFDQLEEVNQPLSQRQRSDLTTYSPSPELTRGEKLDLNNLTFSNTNINAGTELPADVDPNSQHLYGRLMPYTAGKINEDEQTGQCSITFCDEPSEVKQLRSSRPMGSLPTREQRSMMHTPLRVLEEVFLGWHKRRSTVVSQLKREMEKSFADGIDLAETPIQIEAMGVELAKYRKRLNSLDIYAAELFGVHLAVMSSQMHMERLGDIEDAVHQLLMNSSVSDGLTSSSISEQSGGNYPEVRDHDLEARCSSGQLCKNNVSDCRMDSSDSAKPNHGLDDPQPAHLSRNQNYLSPMMSTGLEDMEEVEYGAQHVYPMSQANSFIGLEECHPISEEAPLDVQFPAENPPLQARISLVPIPIKSPSFSAFDATQKGGEYVRTRSRYPSRRDSTSQNPVKHDNTQHKQAIQTRSQTHSPSGKTFRPNRHPSPTKLTTGSLTSSTWKLRSRRK